MDRVRFSTKTVKSSLVKDYSIYNRRKAITRFNPPFG